MIDSNITVTKDKQDQNKEKDVQSIIDNLDTLQESLDTFRDVLRSTFIASDQLDVKAVATKLENLKSTYNEIHTELSDNNPESQVSSRKMNLTLFDERLVPTRRKVKVNKYRYDNSKPCKVMVEHFDACATERGSLVSLGSQNSILKYRMQLHIDALTQYFPILEQLQPYDRTLLNAVYSLYEAGNSVFTLQELYKVISGGQYSKLTTEKSKEISERLENMARIRVTLQYHSGTTQTGHFKELQSEYTGYLLPMESIKVQASNNTAVVQACKILQEPIMLKFSKACNQIISVDIGLLNIPKLSNTAQNVVLKEYLIQRIKTAKHGRLNNVILYDTIIEDCGIAFTEANKKNVRQKLRAKVAKILDYWKTVGFISEYTEHKEKGEKTTRSVEVFFEKTS